MNKAHLKKLPKAARREAEMVLATGIGDVRGGPFRRRAMA